MHTLAAVSYTKNFNIHLHLKFVHTKYRGFEVCIQWAGLAFHDPLPSQ